MTLHLRRHPEPPEESLLQRKEAESSEDRHGSNTSEGETVQRRSRNPVDFSAACSTRPPWQLYPFIVDTSLKEKMRHTDGFARRRALTESHIRTHEGKVEVYTDGSKGSSGKVSCSFYVPSLDHHESYRMSDSSSVLAAEMMAIERAVAWATNANISHVVIFSDSLGATEALEQQKSLARLKHLEDLMNALDDYGRRVQSPATFVWIPGHLGIAGNETADTLCREALHSSSVDLQTTLEFREARRTYKDHFLRRWQSDWSTSATGSDYQLIEPDVSLRRKYSDPSRRKEIVITRLRLGHCCLNAQLKLWGRHETGNCDECDIQETVRHFLLECPAQAGLQDQLTQECARKNWTVNLRTVLSQHSCQDLIYRWLQMSGRKN